MTKRITVTLTEKQWDDVLYSLGEGLEHLDMVIDSGGDSQDIAAWEATIKRVERIDGMIRTQLKEGGAK